MYVFLSSFCLFFFFFLMASVAIRARSSKQFFWLIPPTCSSSCCRGPSSTQCFDSPYGNASTSDFATLWRSMATFARTWVYYMLYQLFDGFIYFIMYTHKSHLYIRMCDLISLYRPIAFSLCNSLFDVQFVVEIFILC